MHAPQLEDLFALPLYGPLWEGFHFSVVFITFVIFLNGPPMWVWSHCSPYFLSKLKKKYLKNGGGESELLPTASLQKCSQWLEQGQAGAGKRQVRPCLPHGWQEHQHHSHLRSYVNRKLELGVEVGVECKHCKVGCRCPKLDLKDWTQGHTPHFPSSHCPAPVPESSRGWPG